MKNWLAKATGRPGSTSFRRFDRVVAEATARRSTMARLSDTDLARAASDADASSSGELSADLVAAPGRT